MSAFVIPPEITGLIQLGVAAIACYFMWDLAKNMINQVQTAIASNTAALTQLTAVIAKLCEQDGSNKS